MLLQFYLLNILLSCHCTWRRKFFVSDFKMCCYCIRDRLCLPCQQIKLIIIVHFNVLQFLIIFALYAYLIYIVIAYIFHISYYIFHILLGVKKVLLTLNKSVSFLVVSWIILKYVFSKMLSTSSTNSSFKNNYYGYS